MIALASYLDIKDCHLCGDDDDGDDGDDGDIGGVGGVDGDMIPCVTDNHSNVPSFKNNGRGIKKHGSTALYSRSVVMNSTVGATKKQMQAMNSFML